MHCIKSLYGSVSPMQGPDNLDNLRKLFDKRTPGADEGALYKLLVNFLMLATARRVAYELGLGLGKEEVPALEFALSICNTVNMYGLLMIHAIKNGQDIS
ncbi:hypothetical protein Tco_0968470 [Tanacetum coccineum]